MHDAIKPHDPLKILPKFFFLAWGHSHSGARVAAKLILSMYNGSRFPFDVTELRCLDQSMLEEALVLMRFDSRPQMEVHEWLNRLYGRRDFGARFEHLAHFWRMKGKCKKEFLQPVPELEGGAA